MIFNVYFVQRVVPPEGWGVLGLRVPGAALWGYTVSLSMLVTFVLTPLLGAAADHVRSKKAFLKWFWLLGVSASAGLFFVTPGRVGLAAGLFLLANIGFAGGNVFYNAFLPELCDRSAMGRVSGLGWAVGYLGGGLCLALNLLMLKSPALFGLDAGNFLPVRASLLSVGLWWFVFALPFFRWVPEERRADQRAAPTPWAALRLGWGRLRETFGRAREHRNLFKFLAAYVLYNEGIETIILMASVFGAQALGMSQDELVLCFLMIQGVAFAGALIFGRLADHLRHKKTIGLTLAVYMAVIGWAYVMTSSRDFRQLDHRLVRFAGFLDFGGGGGAGAGREPGGQPVPHGPFDPAGPQRGVLFLLRRGGQTDRGARTLRVRPGQPVGRVAERGAVAVGFFLGGRDASIFCGGEQILKLSQTQRKPSQNTDHRKSPPIIEALGFIAQRNIHARLQLQGSQVNFGGPAVKKPFTSPAYERGWPEAV